MARAFTDLRNQMIRRRPLWRRVLRFPRVLWQHYSVLRIGATWREALPVAWALALVSVRGFGAPRPR